MPIVFLDNYLPDITALLVLEQILEIHPSTDVIVDTVANKTESGIPRLFELGARYYFPKPYKFGKLKEMMNTLEAEANRIIPGTITTSETVKDCQGIVIDDDPDVVDSISNILENKGICVIRQRIQRRRGLSNV